MSTNISKRLLKLESEPVFAARLFQSTYDGDCLACVAYTSSMAAVKQWERERGLYVTPTPEDMMSLKCPLCDRDYEEDGRGYTMEEREMIRQFVLGESQLSQSEMDGILRARFIKLWGAKGAGIFQERTAVFWKVWNEFWAGMGLHGNREKYV